MGLTRRRVFAEEAYCDAYCVFLATVRDVEQISHIIEIAGGDPEAQDPRLPLEKRYTIATQALTELATNQALQDSLRTPIERSPDQVLGASVIWLCNKSDCPLREAYNRYNESSLDMSTILNSGRKANGGSLGVTATLGSHFLEAAHNGSHYG